MRPAARALALWLVLVACGAAAQGLPEVGDLPSGEGRLSGLVRTPAGAPAPSVDVSLIAFQTDGRQGLRRARTDADGRFGFDGIAADPAIVYFVVAQTEGVHHSQRTSFVEGRDTHEIELRIAPTSANTRRARRGDSEVRVQRSCSGLRVDESHALSNRTRSVLFVPEDQRAEVDPILELELPAEAGALESPFGAEPIGLVREGRRLRFWGPLYPGEQKVEFAYTLPAEGASATARWGYPKGARRLTLLADPSVPALQVDALPERRAVEKFGRTHRRFEALWLADGTEVSLATALGEAPPLGTLREAQVWIELDDAMLEVDERLALAPDAAANEASLLCLALPQDASDLRFSEATLSLPIARDPSGALEIRGPLPAGEQVLTLRYRLPSDAQGARYARRFGIELPLLSVLVSDTGVLPETRRMHRRRPVRRVDRNYLHLEAFQVDGQRDGRDRLRATARRPGRAPCGQHRLRRGRGRRAARLPGWPSARTRRGTGRSRIVGGTPAGRARQCLRGHPRPRRGLRHRQADRRGPRRAARRAAATRRPAAGGGAPRRRRRAARDRDGSRPGRRAGRAGGRRRGREAEPRPPLPAPGGILRSRATRWRCGRRACGRLALLPELRWHASGEAALLSALRRSAERGERRRMIGVRVRARSLTKRFGRATALATLDVDLAPGDSLAVLGPNGAGKSTLLRLAAGLARPSEGELLLDDAPAHAREARQRVGYIGHATLLYAALSARENLVFSGRLHGVDDPAARADALLADADLSHASDRPVGEFSRGMLQRVAIARGLVHDPALVLLDEPFTGLDRASSERLAARLAALREDGRSLVLVTHALERASQLCDASLVLCDGRAAHRGRGEDATTLERAYLEAVERAA